MRKKLLVAAVTTSALALTAPLPASATVYGPPKVTVVNSEVLAPFSLALSKGRVFVADGGTSKVSQLVRGSLRTVAEGPQPGEVAGLDVSRNGRYLAYTAQSYSEGAPAALHIVGPRGKHVTADLSGYEARVNPDRKVSYGVKNPSPCVKEAIEKLTAPLPASYQGIVESHPYAVASLGNSWVVADAAGNDLLKVDRKGRISTLSVLPKHPLKITAAIANGLGLPDCTIGVTYNFEAVPTDVEVGRDGWLYVTTLAGGPEDPSLGARSKVFRVHPRTGKAKEIGSGFLGATNLALRDGKIYVTELFAGRISKLRHGKPQSYVELPNVLSVEADSKGLWAGTMAPFGENGPEGTGSIVRITQGKVRR